MMIVRRLQLLQSERGMALVIALGVLLSLSVTGVAVIDYTNSNSRNTTLSKSDQLAFALAEAGINNAMAVLLKPGANALEVPVLPRLERRTAAAVLEHEHLRRRLRRLDRDVVRHLGQRVLAARGRRPRSEPDRRVEADHA